MSFHGFPTPELMTLQGEEGQLPPSWEARPLPVHEDEMPCTFPCLSQAPSSSWKPRCWLTL